MRFAVLAFVPCSTLRAPGRVAADKGRELVLVRSVVGDRDSGAELAAVAKQLLDRLHAGQRGTAALLPQVGFAAEGLGEIP